MARHTKIRSRSLSQNLAVMERAGNSKKTLLEVEKKEWENAICSVCLEFPHNAVLLLCSSYDKGCRPYMCATSSRLSNCLEQFKKAYAKDEYAQHKLGGDNASCEMSLPKVMEFSCPLCRGQVKGWTVVEPARKYLNKKRRGCMQDNCFFRGTYKKLRKHARTEHASAKPRRVDPVLEQKWKTLENERERDDVMSTIRSSMPGSIVFGDYVIDMNGSDSADVWFSEEDDDLEMVASSRSRRRIPRRFLRAFFWERARRTRFRRHEFLDDWYEDDDVGFVRDTVGSAAEPINILSDEEESKMISSHHCQR